MKKRTLILAAAGLLTAGSLASAASLWGTYKGYNKIRLTVDGKPVKVADVPAIGFNGRTMVPLYLLQQAGLKYSWDAKKETVDIKKAVQEKPFDPVAAVKSIMALGGRGFTYYEGPNGLTGVVYFDQQFDVDTDWGAMYDIFLMLPGYKADYYEIEYLDSDERWAGTYAIDHETLARHAAGELTYDDILDDWYVDEPGVYADGETWEETGEAEEVEEAEG